MLISTSPKWSLNGIDIKKGLIRFSIYLLASALIYIAKLVLGFDFSVFGQFSAVAQMSSSLILGFVGDLVRHLGTDYSVNLPASLPTPNSTNQ